MAHGRVQDVGKESGGQSGGDLASAPDGERAPGPTTAPSVFAVQLTNFSGPFDLLLTLISRRELDVTEIALAEVTDEFIAHIRHLQAVEGQWKLDEASEFLVVAATLLDLKAAKLLPAGTGVVEDEGDIALLEARDLLFARLLQYRAFKEMARELFHRLEEEAERHPRDAPPEPEVLALLPELRWRSTAEDFAALAARVLAPRGEEPAVVETGHLVSAQVSIGEQSAVLAELLQLNGAMTFGQLTRDGSSAAVLVARFLALLDLFRDGSVSFDQAAPLAELRVSWRTDDA